MLISKVIYHLNKLIETKINLKFYKYPVIKILYSRFNGNNKKKKLI